MSNLIQTTDTEIIVEKPDWMDDDTWIQVKGEVLEHLRRETNKAIVAAGRPCPEYAWCTITNPEEHQEVHAGELVDLSEYGEDEDGREKGWYCYLVDRNPTAVNPRLRLEGIVDGVSHQTELDAYDVKLLLVATKDPDADEALRQLIDRANDEGPR